MASVDLRHAYYSVPKEHQIFLRFSWNNKIFQFTCLPNGLASAPRYFTKIMKPVYARLRNLGYTNVGYIDDSLLCGDTYYECKENIQKTVSSIEQIGFIIHPEKSQFEPSKKITFLGNIIDSEEMIVTLPIDKKRTHCRRMQKIILERSR